MARNVPAWVDGAKQQESFPTSPPVSLYGATKLASETLALEYGDAFEFPVWVQGTSHLQNDRPELIADSQISLRSAGCG